MTSKNRFLFCVGDFFTGKIPGNELLRLSRHLFGCDRTVVIGISRRDCQQRDADQKRHHFLVFFIFSIFLSGDHPIGLYGTKLRTDFGANLEFRYFNKIFFPNPIIYFDTDPKPADMLRLSSEKGISDRVRTGNRGLSPKSAKTVVIFECS